MKKINWKKQGAILRTMRENAAGFLAELEAARTSRPGAGDLLIVPAGLCLEDVGMLSRCCRLAAAELDQARKQASLPPRQQFLLVDPQSILAFLETNRQFFPSQLQQRLTGIENKLRAMDLQQKNKSEVHHPAEATTDSTEIKNPRSIDSCSNSNKETPVRQSWTKTLREMTALELVDRLLQLAKRKESTTKPELYRDLMGLPLFHCVCVHDFDAAEQFRSPSALKQVQTSRHSSKSQAKAK